MTDQTTTETEQLASVTPIGDAPAKPRRRNNRTARAQQIAERDALAAAEANAAQTEFVANQRVTHAPTGNVGVIRTILDSESGQLAEIAWTDDAAVTGVSVVPVGELQPNPVELLDELLGATGSDETGQDASALTDDERAQLAEHAATLAPVRATWKQHGNPQTFAFYGTAIKSPAESPTHVASVTFDGQSLNLIGDDGATVERGQFGAATKFWAHVPSASVPASAEPAETKPAKRQRAERVARVEGVGDVPAGYLALKKTPTFEQFRKADPTAEGPEWLTRCVEHGATASALNRKAGRALGSSTERAIWCDGCKTKAAAKLAGPGASASAEPAESASADDDLLVDPKPAKPRRSRKSAK